MTDDEYKFLIGRICKETSTLAELIAGVRGDIAALSQFIIETSHVSDAEKKQLHERLKTMRERMQNRLSEFPAPDPPFLDSE